MTDHKDDANTQQPVNSETELEFLDVADEIDNVLTQFQLATADVPTASLPTPPAPPADAPLTPAGPSDTRPYVRLSRTLSHFPPKSRKQFCTAYRAAFRNGIISALELKGVWFSVRWYEDGQARRRRLAEEIIRDTAAFREWLEIQETDERYARRAETGRLATTLADLESGADDFDRLVALRRKKAQEDGGDE